LEEYEVDKTESPGLTWDFMWSANVEEGREKGLMRQAFNQTLENIPSFTESTPDSVALADAALKVCSYLTDKLVPADISR
jgi:transcription factor C subunit 3